MKRKGQMWMTDLVISIVLFTAATIVAFTVVMNAFSTGSTFGDVKKDAVRISEYILSEGTPADWNETNLVRPGFISYSRVNSTKVYKGMNMTNSSYSAVKSLLQMGTETDFAVVFRNSSGGLIPFQDYCSFGKPWAAIEYSIGPPLECQAVNFTGMTYKNLIKLNRYAVYDSQLVGVEVYVWN